MRAALVREAGHTPVPVDREPPACAAGAVPVAVRAAPITPLDRLCATGTSYFGVPATPYVPGVQGVGVVERDAAGLPAGTPVWFATPAGMGPGDGSMAEHVAVPAGDVVALPAGADPVLVAALGLSAVAAWMALTWRGGLVAGEQVLVLGAGGVVGQAGVQLARLAGARRVIAAARSQAARDRALALGADAAVALSALPAPDTAAVDVLADRIGDACDGPLDLVLDPLYGVPAAAAARALRPGGRLVNLGGSAGERTPLDSSTLRSRALDVRGYTNNALTPAQRAAALGVVAAHAAAGRLTVEHAVRPLDDVFSVWSRSGPRVVLVPGTEE